MVSTPSASMLFNRISAPDSFTAPIPVIPSPRPQNLIYRKMAGSRPAIRPF
jgi:hypothetical protein